MKNMAELEICCDNYASAEAATLGGADRIELCSAIGEGGLTPSLGIIKEVLKNLDIKVHILIRPRGGDFFYSEAEFSIIKSDIESCKKLGAHGVVIGFLKENGHVDLEKTSEIIQLARPMKVTFHRAFDMCKDPLRALEELKELKVDYLLSSGQAPKAMEGIELIRQMVERAGDHLKIMPGSGVRTHLLKELHEKTQAHAYHMSARIPLESKMQFRQQKVSMGSQSQEAEYLSHTHDVEQIKLAKAILS
jgi:copper homeostasis protein